MQPPDGVLVAHLCQLGFMLQPEQSVACLLGFSQQGLVEGHHHSVYLGRQAGRSW
jgi:hypothetical protein